MVAVLYWSMIRCQECLDLYPRDVTPPTEGREALVDVKCGKGAKQRQIPLSRDGWLYLERWLAERKRLRIDASSPLFCQITLNRMGRPLQSAYVRHLMPRLAARAGVDKRVRNLIEAMIIQRVIAPGSKLAFHRALAPATATSSLALGDMPHNWMAAEMILLIRDMLMREAGQAIAIGPMPDGWLPPGGTVAISNFPTALGTQSYRLTRSADGATLHLTFSGSPPPGGYTFQVSDALAAQSYTVDGGPTQDATSDTLTLPASAKSVTVRVATR